MKIADNLAQLTTEECIQLVKRLWVEKAAELRPVIEWGATLMGCDYNEACSTLRTGVANMLIRGRSATDIAKVLHHTINLAGPLVEAHKVIF